MDQKKRKLQQEKRKLQYGKMQLQQRNMEIAPYLRIWVAVISVFYLGVVVFSDFDPPIEEKPSTPKMEGEVKKKPETIVKLESESIEHYAKRNGNGKPVSKEQAQAVAKKANETKAEVEANFDPSKTISFADAKQIVEMSGIEALSAFEKKGMRDVKHDNLYMWLSIPHFVELYNVYKTRKRNFFEELYAPLIKPDGTPALDTNGDPIYHFSLVVEDINYIYEQTGVWLDLAWGVRLENLRYVVWARSLLSCQTNGNAVDGPIDNIMYYGSKWFGSGETANAICTSEVKQDIAAKPKNPGHGHPAIDCDNCMNNKKVHNLLIKLGYKGGCESKMWENDGRHYSFTTIKATADEKESCLDKNPQLR